MFRTALRTATRQSIPKTFRRNVSTEPPHLKSRSWKNSALRWGLAGAGVYYYNTSPVFAEHPQSNLLNPDLDAEDDNALDRLLESSKVQSQKNTSTLQSAIERGSEKAAEQTQENHEALQPDSTHPVTSGASDLEEEAAGEGAFNPETGEINWDCPCLGGMAYGPCGEEFRTAFSCFVYSTEEPKGMDCVEKFGAMQDCFRAHPEVYQGELEDGDDMTEEKEELKREIEERREQVQQAQKEKQGDEKPQAPAKTTSHTPEEYSAEKEVESPGKSRVVREPKTKGTDAAAVPESESLVPKAAHDASSASDGMSVAR